MLRIFGTTHIVIIREITKYKTQIILGGIQSINQI